MSVERDEGHMISRREIMRRIGIISGNGVVGVLLASCGIKPSTERSGPNISTPRLSASRPTSPEKHEAAKYPEHRVTATVFHIGEKPSKDNAMIGNTSTEWESNAVKYLGGIDDPDHRGAHGLPNFVPKENPFYFALPASEYDDNGPIPGARESSPWASEIRALPKDDSRSLFKGRWIEVRIPGTDAVVYGQWLDTGPGDDPKSVRDYPYVFGDGSQKPKNTFGLRAGIDLSPSMAAQLGFGVDEGSAEVTWRFVDPKDVPDGPWKKYPPIANKTHWD